MCFLHLCSIAYGQVGEVTDGVISETNHVHDSKNDATVGLIRTHYDTSFGECSTLLMLGVGTSMSVRDYDNLSIRIAAGSSIIVVIADHNEHNIQKTSPEKYARMANAVYGNMSNLLPTCKGKEPLILIGGHSASGEAVIRALKSNLLDFDPDGFVGLDPYEISAKTMGRNKFLLEFPSINWGFAKTTCLVTKQKAAKAVYELTDSNARVLYEINNKEKDCKITHCVFSDRGCGITPFLCPTTSAENDWVLTSVARSIHVFVDAAMKRTPFDKSHFQLDPSNKVEIYVNEEQIA